LKLLEDIIGCVDVKVLEVKVLYEMLSEMIG
jgi:hypothetical protein